MGSDHGRHMGVRALPAAPGRRDDPLCLPNWGNEQARTLVLLLAIVPAVFIFPYKNLGAQDAQGNRFYRAYFTADFIWHTALTAELMKYDMPPINPYLGTEPFSTTGRISWFPRLSRRKGLQDSRTSSVVLKVNALCSGVLFLAALIIATWSASRSTSGTTIAIVIGVLAVSAEGVYMAWNLRSAADRWSF